MKQLFVEGAVHRAGTSRVCGGLGVFSEDGDCHARFVRGIAMTPQLMAVRAARYALDHSCSACSAVLITSSTFLVKLAQAWGPCWRLRGWSTKQGNQIRQEFKGFLERLWASGSTVRLVDLVDPADRRGYEAATVLQCSAAELGGRGAMRKSPILSQPW